MASPQADISLPQEVIDLHRLESLRDNLEAMRREKNRKGLDKIYLCPKHKEFFDLESRVQVFIGANRAGKTSTGAYKALRLIEGTHPAQLEGRFQKPPLKGRIAANDFSSGIEMIIIQKMREMQPDGWKYEYDKRNHILYITNADGVTSTVFLNSYDQETAKHAGVDLDFVWTDEEPPAAVYKENRMRLLDRQGWMFMTFTADQCTPWSFELFKKNKDPNVKIVNVSIWDNKNEKGDCRIPEDAIEAIRRGLSKAEQEIKLEGKISSLSGLVWPEFDETKHIKDIKIEHHWTRYMAIDYHMRNEVFCLWVAYTPDNRVIVYDEAMLAGTVKDIARVMKEHEGGASMFIRLIDSISSTPERGGDVETCAKDELIGAGVTPLIAACKDKVGFSLVREWLQGNKFFVLPKCEEFIDQILSYQYEDFARRKELKNPKEEVRKLDDHLMDCLKYISNYKPFYSKPGSLESTEAPFKSDSKTGYIYARR